MLRLSGENGMRSVQNDGMAIFAGTNPAVRPECADAVGELFDTQATEEAEDSEEDERL